MKNLELATFGGGCFWCIEAVIQRVNGVETVASGYAGGRTENPTYRQVCSGDSGHAEVVQVTFDPAVLSYEDLITVFMTSHDPTSVNGQGADHGTQYRSVVYFHHEEQKATAEKVFEDLKGIFSKPIATELSPLDTFYIAEDYHQNYYNSNPNYGYCRVVIDPKVTKLRALHADKVKTNKVA